MTKLKEDYSSAEGVEEDKAMRQEFLWSIISCILILAIPSFCFSQDRDKYVTEIKDIHKDIQIINLLNNLNLRREQMEFIVAEAEEVKSLRNNSLRQIQYYATEMNNTYETIKGEVKEGRVTLDKDIVKDFRERQDRIKKIMRDEHSKVDDIASEVENKLESFQLIALDEYKPCIIPIVSNGRIGQSDSGFGITKVLERVKSIPPEKYNRKRYSIVEHLMEKIKEKLPPHIQINETEAKTEILKTFDSIRRMDDVDFQLKKQSIIDELKNRIFPEKPKMSRKDKIKKFLLSENIIPILEEQLYK